jgi:hypothetical protein
VTGAGGIRPRAAQAGFSRFHSAIVPAKIKEMNRKRFSARLITLFVIMATSSTSSAWIQFLDGSALPEAPWQIFDDPAGNGAGAIVDFVDPATGQTNQAIRVYSGTGAFEYFMGPFVTDETGAEVVIAARFRIAAFSATGKENLVCATTRSEPKAPAPSITLVNGRLKLWSYVSSDREIADLGPAETNRFHTVYLYARKDGQVKLWWDGSVLFDGLAPLVNTFDGYVEWGSGSWQFDASDTIDFDWVGYGDASDLPQSLEVAHGGNAVVISWSTNATQFVLQSTDNLNPANWLDVSNPAAIVDGRNTVTNVISGPARFFRLHR